MSKIILCALTALATFALTGAVALAHNDPDPFPAVSQPVCENQYEGDWSFVAGAPPTTTCVVTDTQEGVPVGQPQAGFTADIETTTTYTKTGGTETHVHGAPTVIACYNSQGQPVSTTGANCQP